MTAARAAKFARVWLDTWVLPQVVALVPEVREQIAERERRAEAEAS